MVLFWRKSTYFRQYIGFYSHGKAWKTIKDLGYRSFEDVLFFCGLKAGGISAGWLGPHLGFNLSIVDKSACQVSLWDIQGMGFWVKIIGEGQHPLRLDFLRSCHGERFGSKLIWALVLFDGAISLGFPRHLSVFFFTWVLGVEFTKSRWSLKV